MKLAKLNTAQGPGYVVLDQRALRRPVMRGRQQCVEAQQEENGAIDRNGRRVNLTTPLGTLDFSGHGDDHRVFFALVRRSGLRERVICQPACGADQ